MTSAKSVNRSAGQELKQLRSVSESKESLFFILFHLLFDVLKFKIFHSFVIAKLPSLFFTRMYFAFFLIDYKFVGLINHQ